MNLFADIRDLVIDALDATGGRRDAARRAQELVT